MIAADGSPLCPWCEVRMLKTVAASVDHGVYRGIPHDAYECPECSARLQIVSMSVVEQAYEQMRRDEAPADEAPATLPVESQS